MVLVALPAGGIIAKLAPDGIITLSFVFPAGIDELEDVDELLLGLPTVFETPTMDSEGVAEFPELFANGVTRKEETACFAILASA